jgi:hypothetical protein
MAIISLDQWIFIIISVLTLLFGSGLYFRFKRRKKKASAVISESRKKDVGNSLRKTMKIRVGDFETFPWRSSNLKISVIDIVQETFKMQCVELESYGVDLEVNTGGGLVFGGYSAKETDVNRYKIPVKRFQNEEPCSIFAFHCGDNYFSFMRICVEHVNPHTNEVTLNVFCYSS